MLVQQNLNRNIQPNNSFKCVSTRKIFEFVGNNFSTPEQKLIVATTATVLRPLMDLKYAEEDKKVDAAIKSTSKAIAGGLTGVAIRKFFITFTNKTIKLPTVFAPNAEIKASQSQILETLKKEGKANYKILHKNRINKLLMPQNIINSLVEKEELKSAINKLSEKKELKDIVDKLITKKEFEDIADKILQKEKNKNNAEKLLEIENEIKKIFDKLIEECKVKDIINKLAIKEEVWDFVEKLAKKKNLENIPQNLKKYNNALGGLIAVLVMTFFTNSKIDAPLTSDFQDIITGIVKDNKSAEDMIKEVAGKRYSNIKKLAGEKRENIKNSQKKLTPCTVNNIKNEG